MKARVLSGIQLTGSPHIVYLGALKNWAKIQYDYDTYCIVDLHQPTG